MNNNLKRSSHLFIEQNETFHKNKPFSHIKSLLTMWTLNKHLHLASGPVIPKTIFPWRMTFPKRLIKRIKLNIVSNLLIKIKEKLGRKTVFLRVFPSEPCSRVGQSRTLYLNVWNRTSRLNVRYIFSVFTCFNRARNLFQVSILVGLDTF